MKNLSRPIALAILLGSFGAALPVQAQEFKAGFIHTDRVFREASTAKAAQAKLEQEFSRRDKELNDLGATLKSATEKFERDAPTLSESQRMARQRQLVDQEKYDIIVDQAVYISPKHDITDKVIKALNAAPAK